MQHVIKYVALAVAIGQSIVLGDVCARRWLFYLARHPLPEGKRSPFPGAYRSKHWICAIAWAVYFAL